MDFPQDLTICVDVESNPGDTELSQKSSLSSTRSSTSLSRIVYSRMELRSLRKLVSSYIAPTVFNRLQSLCILRKRGNRGGYRRSGSGFQSIRSLGNLDSQRESIAYSRSCHVNHANLIQINTSHHIQFNHPYRFKYANSANLITVPQKPCLSPPLCSTSTHGALCKNSACLSTSWLVNIVVVRGIF